MKKKIEHVYFLTKNIYINNNRSSDFRICIIQQKYVLESIKKLSLRNFQEPKSLFFYGYYG